MRRKRDLRRDRSAETTAALFGIRTGNVQLVSGDSSAIVQFPNDGQIVVDGEPEHVHNDRAADFSKERHLFGNESFDTDVLQTDGIQHARRCGKKAFGTVLACCIAHKLTPYL